MAEKGFRMIKGLAIFFILFFSKFSFASSCGGVNEEFILQSEAYPNIFVGVVTKAYIEDFKELRGGKRAVAEFELIEVIKGNPEKLKFAYFVNDGHFIVLGRKHLFITDEKGFAHYCGNSGDIDVFGTSGSKNRLIFLNNIKNKLGK